MGMQLIKSNKRPVVTVSRELIRVYAKNTKGNGKFDSNWLNADATVLVLSFLGWTIPSAIPVSRFGGSSLFSKFLSSIAVELGRFPKGPALDSDFWLHLALYHIGLFLCMLLGQIGVQGRKQGYFS